jgi:TPR repeat protein
MTSAEDIYFDLEPELANLKLLELAAAGNHDAEFYLGHIADEASPPDAEEALTWYKKAAEGGHLEAKHWFASFLYHGMGADQDLNAAVLMFRECAAAGLDASQWKLGQHLLQFPEARTEALEWLKLASVQGHTAAIELLAQSQKLA